MERAGSRRDILVSVRVENSGRYGWRRGRPAVCARRFVPRAEAAQRAEGVPAHPSGTLRETDVRFTVPVSELAFWDVTRDAYCIESGTYTLMIGGASGDIRVQKKLAVDGDTVPLRDLTKETSSGELRRVRRRLSGRMPGRRELHPVVGRGRLAAI